MTDDPCNVLITRFVDVPGKGIVPLEAHDQDTGQPESPRGLEAFYIALRKGDLQIAQTLLDAAATSDADVAEVAASRLFLMMLSGDLADAEAQLQQLQGSASAGKPTLDAALAAVGMVRGEVKEAAARIEQVLAVEPRHEMGRYLFALWRAQTGDLQQAHDVLVGLCRDYPDHALARLQLGQVLMAAGDMARAGTLFESAIDGSPKLMQAWERFATLLVLGGQPVEAIAIARRGLAWHPASRALLEVLARSALAVNNADVALDATRLVLVRAQDDAVAHANYAVALVAAGQRSEARVAIREGIRRFPGDSSLVQLQSEIES